MEIIIEIKTEEKLKYWNIVLGATSIFNYESHTVEGRRMVDTTDDLLKECKRTYKKRINRFRIKKTCEKIIEYDRSNLICMICNAKCASFR